jgi:hypothetical protein
MRGLMVFGQQHIEALNEIAIANGSYPANGRIYWYWGCGDI